MKKYQFLVMALAALLLLHPVQAAAASVSGNDRPVCLVETKRFATGEPNDPVIWYYDDVPMTYASSPDFTFSGNYTYFYKENDVDEVDYSGSYNLGSAVSFYGGSMFLNFQLSNIEAGSTKVSITYETNIFELGYDVGDFTFVYDVDGSDEWYTFTRDDLGTSGTNTVSFEIYTYDGYVDGQFHFWIYDFSTNPLIEFGIKDITIGDPISESEQLTNAIRDALPDIESDTVSDFESHYSDYSEAEGAVIDPALNTMNSFHFSDHSFDGMGSGFLAAIAFISSTMDTMFNLTSFSDYFFVVGTVIIVSIVVGLRRLWIRSK